MAGSAEHNVYHANSPVLTTLVPSPTEPFELGDSSLLKNATPKGKNGRNTSNKVRVVIVTGLCEAPCSASQDLSENAAYQNQRKIHGLCKSCSRTTDMGLHLHGC